MNSNMRGWTLEQIKELPRLTLRTPSGACARCAKPAYLGFLHCSACFYEPATYLGAAGEPTSDPTVSRAEVESGAKLRSLWLRWTEMDDSPRRTSFQEVSLAEVRSRGRGHGAPRDVSRWDNFNGTGER